MMYDGKCRKHFAVLSVQRNDAFAVDSMDENDFWDNKKNSNYY